MTASPVDTTTDLHAVIAALRTERDAALSEKAALAEALATRDSEYGERIEQQSATIDVLQAMSASPGDPQPVFDLIVHHANELCDGSGVGLFEFDGNLVHLRANVFGDAGEAEIAGYRAMFPMVPLRGSISCRAILDKQIIHIKDYQNDREVHPTVRAMGYQSQLSIPLMREGTAVGVISLGGPLGGFTDSQIALLQTFAEQAVIAITSAEMYRALQGRTSDLQEALEQQTATAEVLNVISRSTFDLTPVLNKVAETATRLCVADQAAIYLVQGDRVRLATNFGFPPEYEAAIANWGEFPGFPNPVTVGYRTLAERQTVHILDVTAVPGYSEVPVKLGKQRTSLGIPLLRNSEAIGLILLARQRVEPFTDRQIELVSTFADQAVIAIENTRLLTEQREALEQQTATAEVLQVINSSPGVLTPVFEAMLEKAIRLCRGDRGVLWTIDGGRGRIAAARGLPVEFVALLRERGESGTNSPLQRVVQGEWLIEFRDTVDEFSRSGDPHAKGAVEAGVRSAIWVAIVKEGVAVGAFAIGRPVIGTFSDKQIALLQNFAAQAVIAMDNARLITEQREALEQQTATAEVLQVINSSPGDLKPVFETLLDRAMRLCGANFGEFQLFDGERLRLAAFNGVPGALAEFRRNSATLPTRGPTTLRMRDGANVIHTADLMAEDAYREGNPHRRALVDLGGARTVLAVALRKDDKLLGAINIYRQEVKPFSDRQVALLQSFAAQAIIAMENARLLTETREALEQQTATAEVLQVINASPGDLAPVFDAILEKAHRICGAAIGSLILYDGEFLRAAATHGFTDEFADKIRQPFRPAGRYQRLIDGERFVKAMPVDANSLRQAEVSGVRSTLAVPLRKDTVFLGAITAHRTDLRSFAEREIALLENFAAQAVIAMDNARLINEQREALEQQTATAEVLQVINASPGNLAPVFDAMLEKAIRLCGSSFGSLATYDGEAFHVVAMRGVAPALAEFFRAPILPVPGMTLYRTIHGEDVVHVADLTDDEMYRSGNPVRRALTDLGGARTQLLVALRKDDALLGAFNVFRQDVRPFSDKQIALLKNFAAQAVIAMENARLITEQREALEQQTATAEVLQVINANPGNLTPVFDAILEKAHSRCNVAVGSLSVYVDGLVHTAATRGFSEEYQALLRRPYAAIGSHQALLRGAPSIQTPDFRTVPVSPVMASSLDHLERMKLRTGLWVPLRKDGTALGCISSYRDRVQPFSEKEIALLENFAAQAVIAMENARLLDEIRQRQEELRITFENMGDGVAMFDETQRLIAWNHKFQDILDVPDDIIARRQTFSEYLHYLAERGEYGPEADPEEHVRRLIEQADQSRTYERARPDGRVIEIRHNPVPDGGFVLIYADITERKRNEAEIHAARDAAEEASRTIEAAYRELKTAQANLIQAEKMASLGQLTAGIAHEIKNPLNFVNNFAALSVDLLSELKETAAPGFAVLTDKQRAEVEEVSVMLTSNLGKIAEHGKRADDIVKAMLEHSRGSSGERRKVDINTLTDEALNLAYHGARAQDQSFNITLARNFGAGIAPIEVNPQDITRVFLNLFSNGFYAATRRAREGGDAAFAPTLTVTTRDAGEAVEIRVRDNGIGIPADIRDKLFQPFFTTKPTGEGTGLGLSITYDIVTQQHGGDIAVDSKVGDYSEFTIRLPRKP